MTSPPIPEITPQQLARKIDLGEKLQIVDIRPASSVAAARIETGEQGSFQNIPVSSLLSNSSLPASIEPSNPTVVVCARGNDSKIATVLLRRLGVSAWSLAGGMTAWMNLLVPRKLDAPPSLDHLIQFDRPGKGSLSYVLISAGEAMVIDPSRNLGPYRDVMKEAGARPVAVADTHIHADYISGGVAMSRELGIPYYLHPADAIYPYDGTPGSLSITPIDDGMTINIGRCSLTVNTTPGHSPGSVTYRVGGDAAFTGDFLFLLSVGRPDLAGRTEAWAPLLWESIQRAMRNWPPHLMVYPAHYSGGEHRLPNHAVGAPLGELVRHNVSLEKRSMPEFLDYVRKMDAPFPEAYRTIKAINVGLSSVGDAEADLLEFGKNECALSGS